MNKEKKYLKVHFIDVSIWASNFIFFVLGMISMIIKNKCPYKMQLGFSVFVVILFLISMTTFMLLKKKKLCIVILLCFIVLVISYFYEMEIIYMSVPLTLIISSIFKIIYFHRHKSEQFNRRINIFVLIPVQLAIAVGVLIGVVIG